MLIIIDFSSTVEKELNLISALIFFKDRLWFQRNKTGYDRMLFVVYFLCLLGCWATSSTPVVL